MVGPLRRLCGKQVGSRVALVCKVDVSVGVVDMPERAPRLGTRATALDCRDSPTNRRGEGRIVLFEFGTGPIKGFAVTLSVGILTSLFAALVITRLLFQLYPGTRPVQTLSI